MTLRLDTEAGKHRAFKGGLKWIITNTGLGTNQLKTQGWELIIQMRTGTGTNQIWARE